jgi:hypothetical protein
MELRTEVEIDAEPQRVWSVLVDFERYPQWNPFVSSLEGAIALGAPLALVITPADGSERRQRATLSRFEPGRQLGWKTRLWLPGLFDGEHFVQLDETGEGRTRLINAADFRGVLVNYMGRALTETTRGLVGMNQALKRRIESPQ